MSREPIQKAVRIIAGDQYSLAATVYSPVPDEGAGCLVLVCSALAVRQRFYAQFARFLATQGATVVSFDYRGVGASQNGPLRSHPARMQDWGILDISAMIDWAQQTYPTHRLTVVAHSAGGQVFGLAPNNNAISRVLGVAAQSGYWGHWPFPQNLKLWLLWHAVIPVLTATFGFFPGGWLGLGHLPTGVARQWARWGRSRHYITEPSGAPWREPFHGFRGRLKLLVPAGDWLTPLPAVYALAGFYANAEVQVELLPGVEQNHMGHFGFFRAEPGVTPALWPQYWSWLASSDI